MGLVGFDDGETLAQLKILACKIFHFYVYEVASSGSVHETGMRWDIDASSIGIQVVLVLLIDC